MTDGGQKGYLKFGMALLIGAFVFASLLCAPFRAHADTIRFFNVTFDGSGKYQYVDSDEVLEVKFSFHAVYNQSPPSTPVILSEDNASSPDTWGNGIGMSSSDLTGTFTLTLPDSVCSGTISGEDYSVYVYAIKNILAPGSGYIFRVESVDELALHGCADAPVEWGFGITPTRDFFAAEFTLPPDALAQNKIIQYVSKSITGPGEYTGSVQSISWNGTVTFEKVGEYSVPSTPPPSPNGYSFSYAPTNTPVVSADPAQAEPIGLGPAADGGDTLDISVAFSCPDPVDLYLALYAPAISQDILMIGPGLSVQPLSQGLLKWGENVSGPVETTVIRDIPLDALPGGTYSFYLVATPPYSAASYYLWTTQFEK